MTTELVVRATQVLLERTARTVGLEFFRALARGLAETLGTRYAFVGELCEPGGTVRTLAVWRGDHHGEDFTYALGGTPCADVVARGLCHYTSGVAELFPDDAMLAEMGAESYLGLPITGPGDKRLGVLGAIHDHPTAPMPELANVLALFADRAAAELERMRFEADLARSEARFRQIVSTCIEGVWTIDTQTVTTFVNRQMADMLGFSEAEMLGRKVSEFTDDDGRAEAKRNLERRKDGVAERHEFRLLHKSGREVWTVMATNPLYDEAGAYCGALALVTDITERRALEASRARAQKLESLGVLAGGVAHDFNNLLVGVLANVELATRALERPAPNLEIVRPALGDIQTAALRAVDLIRQLLAFSGKGHLVVSRVDLNTLVGDMTRLLSNAVSPSTRVVFAPTAERTLVDGDAGQLGQIVMNLILNGSESLGDRAGTVTLTTATVQADEDYLVRALADASLAPGEYVCLDVTDTGSGMDDATLARIFEPFYTTKVTGRGLGLAAVLGAVRSHGGGIRVLSEVGKGTTFRVLLPAARAPREESAPAAVAPRPEAPERRPLILVVDDERLIRGILRKLLELSGYEVLEAVDGSDAIAQFRGRPSEIGLVLLDMTMPGLSGDQIFDELHRLRPDVQVVVSSGYSEEDASARFAGRKLAGFLQKPWKPTDVDAVVKRALQDPPSTRTRTVLP